MNAAQLTAWIITIGCVLLLICGIIFETHLFIAGQPKGKINGK